MKKIQKSAALLALACALHTGSSLAQQPAAMQPKSVFEQMLVYVYQHNPQLAAERDAVKVADEKVSQAVAGFRPSLAANAAAGRQRQKVGGGDWQTGDANSMSLSATQPIFSGFGTVAQRRAADQRVMAARSRLLAVEQAVLLQAVGSWLEMGEKERILTLTEENLQRMHMYGRATRERFKAGDGTQTDIAQAESRLAQAEARHAQAAAERDTARAAFERMTGLKAPVAELPPLPDALPRNEEETQLQARGNPELAQAAYQEKAAEQDIAAAESSLWPSLALRGSVSEERSPALGLEKLRSDALTLNLSIPLYQGGGEYSRVREAKILREKSRHDAADIGRAVLERARAAWYNYHSAGLVIRAAGRAANASARALSGVEEEQRQGLRTLTDVLDEQTEFLSAQIVQTQAEKNHRLEAFRLMAATGRLTAAGLSLPVEPLDPARHYDDVAGRWAGF